MIPFSLNATKSFRPIAFLSLLTSAFLFFSACGSLSGEKRTPSGTEVAPGASSAPRLQFRLVAEEGETAPTDDFVNPNNWSGKIPTLHILRTVLLDESHIAAAEIRTMADGVSCLWIEWAESGRARFADVTGNNIGGTLAVIFDGELLFAPRIVEKIEGKGSSFPIDEKMTIEKAREIVAIVESR
jgi:preprotein translocase subunit SecD